MYAARALANLCTDANMQPGQPTAAKLAAVRAAVAAGAPAALVRQLRRSPDDRVLEAAARATGS